MSDELPPLESCGFVRVPADTELWMRCDACEKSDHFWIEDEAVRCRCGARYSHALRPDGEQVALSELVFVEFDEGPKQLADLELDPKRLALLVGLLLAIAAGLTWWFIT
jgi:hypothetical protein